MRTRRQTLTARAEAYARAFRVVRGRMLGDVPNWRQAEKRVFQAEMALMDAVREFRRGSKGRDKFAIVAPKCRAVVVVSPASENIAVYDTI